MKVHFCLLDSQCRRWSSWDGWSGLARLYIKTRHSNISIALTPQAKFQRPGSDWRAEDDVWVIRKHRREEKP